MQTTRFLVIHHTYTDVEVALYSNETMIASLSATHRNSSKNLVLTVQKILDQQSIALSDCSFIAVNQGPGPFTTLRVVLATVNGLAYASKIPLVGVNCLEAFIEEYQRTTGDYLVALLNAYCDDLYYAIEDRKRQQREVGCMHSSDLAKKLAALNGSCTLIGNGVSLHRSLFEESLKEKLFIPQPLPEATSLQALARHAWHVWRTQGSQETSLMPLYLKATSAKVSVHIQET